ncbi:MAG: hypothetical protein O7C74_03645, partial [Acidobacteria bacterium]|nr:hypothetical protein [Acidobacteriota bacterium]
MTAKKSGSKWFLYSCFGCLGLTAFLVMIVVGVVGVAYMQVGSEEVQQETITPELLSQAISPGSVELAPGSPAAADLPEQQPRVEADGIPAGGRIILEVQQGGFEIEPGKPGEPLRLEASYDKNAYELEEVLETGADGAWIYRVNFRQTSGVGFMAAIRQMLGGAKPFVKMVLPVDVPLDLEVKVSQGGLEMDVGGLWLRTADIRFQQGGLAFSVATPLREPMEHLSISGSMGGFAALKLGNASPRILDLDFSMGGGFFDLRGEWRNDSRVSV